MKTVMKRIKRAAGLAAVGCMAWAGHLQAQEANRTGPGSDSAKTQLERLLLAAPGPEVYYRLGALFSKSAPPVSVEQVSGKYLCLTVGAFWRPTGAFPKHYETRTFTRSGSGVSMNTVGLPSGYRSTWNLQAGSAGLSAQARSDKGFYYSAAIRRLDAGVLLVEHGASSAETLVVARQAHSDPRQFAESYVACLLEPSEAWLAVAADLQRQMEQAEAREVEDRKKSAILDQQLKRARQESALAFSRLQRTLDRVEAQQRGCMDWDNEDIRVELMVHGYSVCPR